MAKIKMVFFDAGGTLLRTANPVGHTYAGLAEHYGIKADAEKLQECFLQAWKTLTLNFRDPEKGARRKDDRDWWRCLVRRTWEGYGMDEAFPFDDYFDELYDLFARPDLWRTYPDVEINLNRLRKRGVACGILSNWDRRLRGVLEGLELSEFFDPILISSELGVEKPHPKMFRLAEDRCGCSAKGILLIGDDPCCDGDGAKAAGWRVGLIERPSRTLDVVLEEVGLL